MPLAPLPRSAVEFMAWPWSAIQPYYDELETRALDAGTVALWLADWSRLSDLVSEAYSRLQVATTVNTADEEAQILYAQFLDTVYPASEAAEDRCKRKFLAAGLSVPGMEVPCKIMRAEVELFRKENLPLLSREQKMATDYQKIVGAQTVMWEGREVTLRQLLPVYQNPDRALRERAWRLSSSRQLQDRDALNALWVDFLKLRQQIAKNAGEPSYRAFRWKQLRRFDYTPGDCRRFHAAIEQVVVPAATRQYERGRQRAGLDTLRPWDLTAAPGFGNVVLPAGTPALHPFDDASELEARCETMLQQVDPQLGAYFETMRQENLLDLANRKNKAPGGYSLSFEATGLPFIFANAVGLHDDVQTLLHEAGHSFHTFETRHLPYYPQRSYRSIPMEFAEVASMSMELLASPYLAASKGGFYSEVDAARARVEHLQGLLFFWPYMAVVDAFQQWVYENIDAAMDPANCDAQWQLLYNRFLPAVDWREFEDVSATRWHRQLHIFDEPFYYIEYGLAQLGAVQVWRHSLRDQARAVANYRRGLSLGATVPLPELYATAGAKFTFESDTLREAVELIERTIEELDA